METRPAPALPAAPEDDATGPGARTAGGSCGPWAVAAARGAHARIWGTVPHRADAALRRLLKSGQWRAAGAIVGLGLVLSVLIVLVGHILEADPLIDRALAGRASMRRS